jgi:hypothetical protein
MPHPEATTSRRFGRLEMILAYHQVCFWCVRASVKRLGSSAGVRMETGFLAICAHMCQGSLQTPCYACFMLINQAQSAAKLAYDPFGLAARPQLAVSRVAPHDGVSETGPIKAMIAAPQILNRYNVAAAFIHARMRSTQRLLRPRVKAQPLLHHITCHKPTAA